MKSEFSFLSFVTSPLYLFVLFLVLAVLLHLYILYIKNPSDITWKKVDYLWLSLTLIGVFSASGNIERYVSTSLLSNQEIPRLQSSYNMLYDFFSWRASPTRSWYCQNDEYEEGLLIEKVEFEKNINLLNQQCLYFQQKLKELPKEIVDPYPSLDDLNLPRNLPSGVNSNENNTYRKFLNIYEEQYLIYIDTKEKTKMSELEFLMLFFSPIFFCLGLAIRVTKVTGDIMNAEKKKPSKT